MVLLLAFLPTYEIIFTVPPLIALFLHHVCLDCISVVTARGARARATHQFTINNFSSARRFARCVMNTRPRLMKFAPSKFAISDLFFFFFCYSAMKIRIKITATMLVVWSLSILSLVSRTAWAENSVSLKAKMQKVTSSTLKWVTPLGEPIPRDAVVGSVHYIPVGKYALIEIERR